MGESKDDDPFLVLPGTDEYEALSFLIRNRGEKFMPSEIAARTDISESNTPQTIERLFERDLVESSQGDYYVDIAQAEYLQQRLKSVDAAEQLHNTTPNDDIYAMTDWECQLNSR